MSGVAVAGDCLSVFNKVKMRTSDLQWATFRVEENEGSVLTDATGEISGAHDDFLKALPDGECRYAVYDYKYTNADGCEYSKLVFIVESGHGSVEEQNALRIDEGFLQIAPFWDRGRDSSH